MTDADYHINFVLYAVCGKMAEADAMLRIFGDEIRRTADQLCARYPFTPAPIFRGMLLDPAKMFTPDPRLMFQSWSEDRGVAEWFASTDALISEPLVDSNPRLRGFVAELPRPSARVLFHHSWARAFDFPALGALHPHIGLEGARQLAWALQTQREVITAPIGGLVPITCNIDAARLAELEQRLAPPWIREAVS